MTLSSSSASIGVAGQDLALVCTVTVVEHLSESAMVDITWSGGSVGCSGVTESVTRRVSETVITGNLTFGPLNTSHGAEYSCRAIVDIPILNITKTSGNSTNLTVQSKRIIFFRSRFNLCMSLFFCSS